MCDTPYYKRIDGYIEKVPLPCGKCPLCKRKRVNQWAFRLQEEEKVSSSGYFITLTYNTQFVPITNNGFMTLDKKDYQKFMKRLRKREALLHEEKIKYYAAGEYGEETQRPHYHAIIFNVRDLENINKSWELGDIHVGTVTGKSAAYCAKYIDKDKRIPLHARDDRQKEFSLMSKGLGASYLTPQIIKYHKDDLSRCYVKESSGHAVAMPRYYRDRIYTEGEKKQQIKIIRGLKQKEFDDKRVYVARNNEGEDIIYDRLESERQQRYIEFYSRRKIRKS